MTMNDTMLPELMKKDGIDNFAHPIDDMTGEGNAVGDGFEDMTGGGDMMIDADTDMGVESDLMPAMAGGSDC